MLLTTCSLGLGELRSSNSTPRKHSQRQIKKAKELFAKQSIVVPIIVDEHHHIIDGHLRFMVARELGIENLNAVVVSEASTAEIIELELALNRLGEDSNWDEARLKEKLEQLLEFKVDLSFTGFEQAELDKILHFEIIEEEEQNWGGTDPVTRPGDIWRVGDHIIACINALSPELALSELDNLPLAKVCVTDPPYNVPTKGHIRTSHDHQEFAMAAGEMSDAEFEEFLNAFLRVEQLYRNNYSIYNIMFYIVYYGLIGKRYFGPRRRCVSYMEFAPLAPPLYFGIQTMPRSCKRSSTLRSKSGNRT